MVHNYVGECLICHTPIRLRFQVSEEGIPIHFACPKCNTSIEGHIDVIDPNLALTTDIQNWFTYKIFNFKESKSKPLYVIEVSSDFFVQKIKPDTDEPEPSPFLKTMSEVGREGIYNLNIIGDTEKRLIDVLPTMIMVHKLWINKRYSELFAQISSGNDYTDIIQLDSLKNQVKAPIDAFLVLHQARELWLRNIYNESTFVEIRSIRDKIFLIPNAVSKFALYSQMMFKLNYYLDFSKKTLEVTRKFIKLLPNIYPSIHRIDTFNVDDNYGTSYSIDVADEMMALYELMFEVVCEKDDLLIGYNNIIHRGNVDSFVISSKKNGFEKTILEYTKKYRKTKDLLAENESFSCGLIQVLDSTIRNSITHKDAYFNQTDNTFTFPDKIKPECSITISGVHFSFHIIRLFYKLNVLFEYAFWSEFMYRITFGFEKITYGTPN